MSVDSSDIFLERYFYPVQIMRARSDHDSNGDKHNNATHINRSIQKLPGNSNRYALQIDIELDLEKSINPPYEFNLTIVGLFIIKSESIKEEEKEARIFNTGTSLLIGALRERISMLTHSAPWGGFNINVLDIPPVTPEAGKSKKSSKRQPARKKKRNYST